MSSKLMDQVQYRLNWERIFGSQAVRGQVFLLPSEASRVIVQYDPDFRITCLIPTKERDIVIDYPDRTGRRQDLRRKIKSPWLLLSQVTYTSKMPDTAQIMYAQAADPTCPCDRCREVCKQTMEILNHGLFCGCSYCCETSVRALRVKVVYHLFAVDTERNDDIIAQPYRLANIYEDGKICFKKNNGTIYSPQNMRQAHGTFWTHKFDNDFNWTVQHTCDQKIHGFRSCLLRLPKRHRCDTVAHHRHACFGDDFDMDNDRCVCCYDGCTCAKTCPCCGTGTCNCSENWAKTCSCSCCQNVCRCPCGCDLGQDFANMLANYQPNPEKWENYTKFICGERFISSPKNVTGVFVSQNPELLSEIPSKLLCRGRSLGAGPAIVGFATLNQDGWEVDLGDLTFSLNKNQIRCVE